MSPSPPLSPAPPHSITDWKCLYSSGINIWEGKRSPNQKSTGFQLLLDLIFYLWGGKKHPIHSMAYHYKFSLQFVGPWAPSSSINSLYKSIAVIIFWVWVTVFPKWKIQGHHQNAKKIKKNSMSLPFQFLHTHKTELNEPGKIQTRGVFFGKLLWRHPPPPAPPPQYCLPRRKGPANPRYSGNDSTICAKSCAEAVSHILIAISFLSFLFHFILGGGEDCEHGNANRNLKLREQLRKPPSGSTLLVGMGDSVLNNATVFDAFAARVYFFWRETVSAPPTACGCQLTDTKGNTEKRNQKWQN